MLDVKSSLRNESDWLKKKTNLVTLCKIRGRVEILRKAGERRKNTRNAKNCTNVTGKDFSGFLNNG